MENNSIMLFDSKKIRTKWDDEQEKWYFSIVDIVAVLTESQEPTLRSNSERASSLGIMQKVYKLLKNRTA